MKTNTQGEACPDCGDVLDKSGHCVDCVDAMIDQHHARQLDEHLDPGGESAREADGDLNPVWGELGRCDLCGEQSGEDTRYYRVERRSAPAKICEVCEEMILARKFIGFEIGNSR